MITLRNNFHGTETTVRPRDGKLSARQLAAAKQRLCGSPTCTCGGIRGPQDVALQPISQDGAVQICGLYDAVATDTRPQSELRREDIAVPETAYTADTILDGILGRHEERQERSAIVAEVHSYLDAMTCADADDLPGIDRDEVERLVVERICDRLC